MITGRVPNPSRVSTRSAAVIAAKAATAMRIVRAMPKRSPRLAAICEAPKKPIAFSAKARLKPVGDSPNCSV